MPAHKGNPVFGAAVLKLTLLRKLGSVSALGELYEATLKDLGVTGAEVDRYIDDHRPALESAMAKQRGANGTTEGDE